MNGKTVQKFFAELISLRWITSITAGRDYRIDFLRGLGILAVMLLHYGFFTYHAARFISMRLYLASMVNGYLGVSVFFVISGFLITSMALKRYGDLGSIKLSEFYIFRFTRIIPGLLLLVAVNTIGYFAGFAFFKVESLLRVLNYLITLRFNVFTSTIETPMPWAVLWSLAIEEVFYLGFPWIGRVFRTPILISTVLLSLVVYGFFHRMGTGWGLYDYFGCFDQIALGCLVAFLGWRFKFSRFPASLLWTMRFLGLAWMVFTYYSMDVHTEYILAPTSIALGAGLFLAGSMGRPSAREPGQFVRAIALVGALSYELYLFHILGFFWLSGGYDWLVRAEFQNNKFDLLFVLTTSLFVIVSALLYSFLLEPARKSLRQYLTNALAHPQRWRAAFRKARIFSNNADDLG